MPKLLLLRHANAIRYDYDDDSNRRLRKKGKKNARRVGRWLADHQLIPGQVLSSRAERALHTASLVCEAAGLDRALIGIEEAIYPGSVSALMNLLNGLPDDPESVLLVGHNPALEDTLDRLCRDVVPLNSKGRLLSPASLAVLSFDGSWSTLAAGSAALEQMIHSDELE
jgi:phosphohistidine phosphatase